MNRSDYDKIENVLVNFACNDERIPCPTIPDDADKEIRCSNETISCTDCIRKYVVRDIMKEIRAAFGEKTLLRQDIKVFGEGEITAMIVYCGETYEGYGDNAWDAIKDLEKTLADFDLKFEEEE